MTYTVSSGTLNSSIPYHTIRLCRSQLLETVIINGSLITPARQWKKLAF